MARRERGSVRSSVGAGIPGCGPDGLPGSGASGSLFAIRTGFVMGLAAARPGLSTDFLWAGFAAANRPVGGLRGREPASRTWLAANFAGTSRDLGLRNSLGDSIGICGSSRIDVAAGASRNRRSQLRRSAPDCARGAGAAASTTGASISTLCSGRASRASSKLPLEELVGGRRRQREHLDVPALELGEPAARSDFGLQQADVALGEDDLASRRPPAPRAPTRRAATRGSSRAPHRRSWRP